MARTPSLLVAVLVTLAATAGFASAQPPDLTQMSLEQLMDLPVLTVVTASKREQKSTEAPAQATVVTADDIRAYGCRTLARH